MGLKKTVSPWGLIAFTAIIIFAAGSCNIPSNPQPEPFIISFHYITGVAEPGTGEIPVTSFDNNEQYSGTVTWSPAVDGTFAYSTEYTATITLTPKPGYTLKGVPADYFTARGGISNSNAANSGIVTITYPRTGLLMVTKRIIEGLAVPIIGEIPVTAITGNEQYSGTVTWSPDVNGTFADGIEYTATITITPKPGYMLPLRPANDFFTLEGARVYHIKDYIFEATFPRTGIIINIADIRGLSAPVIYGIPVTDIFENEQYTGTVTWSPSAYGTFAASTVYTAIIDLRPKTGYTTQGTTADFFTVEGAATVSNTVNYLYYSTYSIVTVTFPPTGTPADRFEYYWVDQHGSLVIDSGGPITLNAGKTLTISALGDGYVVKQWYLNGINSGQSGNTFVFSSATPGEHTLSLIVEKDGKFYNTNITIKVAPIP